MRQTGGPQARCCPASAGRGPFLWSWARPAGTATLRRAVLGARARWGMYAWLPGGGRALLRHGSVPACAGLNAIRCISLSGGARHRSGGSRAYHRGLGQVRSRGARRAGPVMTGLAPGAQGRGIYTAPRRPGGGQWPRRVLIDPVVTSRLKRQCTSHC